VSASSTEASLRGATGTKSERARQVGSLVGERARAAGIERVVFDRAGFKYHGRIRSLADGAREAGLEF
jgi:large subunit ribosomal protein L18